MSTPPVIGNMSDIMGSVPPEQIKTQPQQSKQFIPGSLHSLLADPVPHQDQSKSQGHEISQAGSMGAGVSGQASGLGQSSSQQSQLNNRRMVNDQYILQANMMGQHQTNLQNPPRTGTSALEASPQSQASQQNPGEVFTNGGQSWSQGKPIQQTPHIHNQQLQLHQSQQQMQQNFRQSQQLQNQRRNFAKHNAVPIKGEDLDRLNSSKQACRPSRYVN